jgi:hypothetical protein
MKLTFMGATREEIRRGLINTLLQQAVAAIDSNLNVLPFLLNYLAFQLNCADFPAPM